MRIVHDNKSGILGVLSKSMCKYANKEDINYHICRKRQSQWTALEYRRLAHIVGSPGFVGCSRQASYFR